MKAKDLSGMTFGMFTVIERDTTKQRRVYFFCKCECGTIRSVEAGNLKAGRHVSCGCTRVENSAKACATHKMTNSREYIAWAGMKRRCYYKDDIMYPSYGGRGITVCNEWLHSFEAFYEYVGKKPSNDHSIDRINVNGNYEPGNVKWSTVVEQANNRRSNHLLTYNGKTQNLTQWANEVNLPFSALKKRIYRGWSAEDALTKPVRTFNFHTL